MSSPVFLLIARSKIQLILYPNSQCSVCWRLIGRLPMYICIVRVVLMAALEALTAESGVVGVGGRNG